MSRHQARRIEGRALYRENLQAVANYMLKGSADDVAPELGLSLRKRGGEVIGKRSGRTQNVGLGHCYDGESQPSAPAF